MNILSSMKYETKYSEYKRYDEMQAVEKFKEIDFSQQYPKAVWSENKYLFLKEIGAKKWYPFIRE